MCGVSNSIEGLIKRIEFRRLWDRKKKRKIIGRNFEVVACRGAGSQISEFLFCVAELTRVVLPQIHLRNQILAYLIADPFIDIGLSLLSCLAI